MSQIKNGGLDQYVAGPFEQQQFGTAGVEGVNNSKCRLDFVDWYKLDLDNNKTAMEKRTLRKEKF